jgi:hypothetical protein
VTYGLNGVIKIIEWERTQNVTSKSKRKYKDKGKDVLDNITEKIKKNNNNNKNSSNGDLSKNYIVKKIINNTQIE